jgi:integrase
MSKAITYYLRFIDELYHMIEENIDLGKIEDKKKFERIRAKYNKISEEHGAEIKHVYYISRDEPFPNLYENADFSADTINASIKDGESKTKQTKGAILILRGKTGERRVRIISFVKLLQQWLQVHALRTQNQYPLWISEATNFKNQPLGLRGAQKVIEETIPKAGLDNKHARLYILRHSRATHLAKHLTEAHSLDGSMEQK